MTIIHRNSFVKQDERYSLDSRIKNIVIQELSEYLNKNLTLVVISSDLGYELEYHDEKTYLIVKDKPSDIKYNFLKREVDLVKNRIFSYNINFLHPNWTSIPLGLCGPPVNFADRIEKSRSTTKNILIYANFNNWCGREHVSSFVKNCPIIHYSPYNNQDVNLFYNELMSSYFAITPPGNGWDSYRFWEALYFRTYPIVIASYFFQNWENLGIPIIQVQNWEDINRDSFTDFLMQKKEEFDKVDYSKFLTEEYWKELITEINNNWDKG